MVVKQALLRVKGYNKYKTGGKKRNGNCLVGNYHSSENIMHMRIDNNKPDLQKGWLELTSRYEFDLFVTLTFREDTERWLAKKRFEKWLVSLNKDLFGRRYEQRGRGIRYVVVYGNQKRGTLHFHALLGAKGLKELDREYMAELWKCNGQQNKKTGTLLNRIVNGHAVIDIYDPARGAKHYLINHIFQGGEPDIFVPRKERVGKACSIETTE
ncbi:MAG: hypothetical protein IH964_13565 [Candidatus Dadabacteria bacterium]|nr:hypothetical protein [Candidatus Dadabacteria bacterium]